MTFHVGQKVVCMEAFDRTIAMLVADDQKTLRGEA
jgi:hypothetical protein